VCVALHMVNTMEQGMPKLSDKSSKSVDMSTAARARDLVIAAAGPRDLRDSVKAMLARSATRLQIGFRRARAIYHGEARLIGADEWDALQRRADELGIRTAWEKAAHERDAMDLRTSPLLVARTPDSGGGSRRQMGAEGARSSAVPAVRPERDT
jgi:hypothetical protein